MFNINVSYDNNTGDTEVKCYGKISREELAAILSALINSLAKAVQLSFDDLFCKVYNMGKDIEDAEHRD